MTLPSGWRFDRIKDVAVINERSLGADTSADEEIDYLEISNVNSSGIVDRNAIEHLRFGDAPSRARRCVREGATIISSVRPNLQAVAYIDKRDAHLVCSTGFYVVSPRIADLLPRYLYYSLLSDDAKQYFVATAKGVGYPSIDDKEFGAFPIAIPSLPEQRRIAAYLDAKCADIDKAIAAKQRQVEMIETLWKNVLHDATLHGVGSRVPRDRAGRAGVPSPSENTTAGGGTPALPSGWKVVRLKDVATVDNGSDPKAEGDVPVYGSGGRSFKTCGEYKMGPAVLLGRKGTIDVPFFVEGKYWNVDTAFDVKPIGGGHAGRVTLPSDDGRGERPARPQKPDGKIDIRYLFYLAHTFDYKFYSTQTTVPSMTQKDYRNMKIPLPPLPEQRQIAAYLDAKRAGFDALAGNLRRQVETLEQYRRSLIRECVTGKRRCA